MTQRISAAELNALSEQARSGPRRRAHLNLHASMDAPVHRLAIAMQPDSYVRPHRHPTRDETLIALRGSFDVLIFDADATLRERHRLGADGLRIIDFEANTLHSLVSLEDGSVFFEIKEGPYQPVQEPDWAAGSAPEGDARVPAYLQWLRQAAIGERYES